MRIVHHLFFSFFSIFLSLLFFIFHVFRSFHLLFSLFAVHFRCAFTSLRTVCLICLVSPERPFCILYNPCMHSYKHTDTQNGLVVQKFALIKNVFIKKKKKKAMHTPSETRLLNAYSQMDCIEARCD